MRCMVLLVLAACTTPPALVAPQAGPPGSLTLEVSPVRPGRPATWTVRGLNPGELVYVGRGPGLSAHGPCLAAAGGLCMDIAGPPALVGTATADGAGTAQLSINLPGTVPVGLSVGFQAIAIRGLRGVSSVKSDAVSRTTAAFAGVDATALPAGGLVITELLRDAVVDDTLGEWFEVLNPGPQDVELYGLEVVSDGGGLRVTEPAVISAGGRFVFGASADVATNGGVDVDYAWGAGLALGDVEGSLSLLGGATLLDDVVWTPDQPAASGQTLSLDPGASTAAGNDVPDAWCASVGTPGLVNEVCPVPACGDGHLDPGEVCDDHNLVSGDGCDAMCLPEGCPVPELTLGSWTFTPGAASMLGLEGLPDGGLVVTGEATVSGRRSLHGGRMNADGTAQTFRTWAAGSAVYQQRLRPALDGGWIVASRFYASAGGAQVDYDYHIAHIDPAGAPVWSNSFSTGPYWSDEVKDLVVLPDGGVIAVGETNYDPVYHVDQRGFVLRLDADGNEVWNQVSTTFRYMRQILALRDGTFLVSGSDWFFRMRADSTIVWSRRFLSPPAVGGQDDMIELENGHLIIAAIVSGQRGFIELDGSGNFVRHTGLYAPGAATVDGQDIAAFPASCVAAPTEGDACTDEGAWCASGAELCSCDGTWICEPGDQRLALAWHIVGENAPGVHDVLLTTFDAAGGVAETASAGPMLTVDRLDVDQHGRLLVTGIGTGAWRSVATDDQLSGCGVTPHAPISDLHLAISVFNSNVRAIGAPERLTTRPVSLVPAVVTAPTQGAVCTEAVCP